MKKILVVFLSLVLLFTLAACDILPDASTRPAVTQPAATDPAVNDPVINPAPEGEETKPQEPEANMVEFTFIVMDKDGNEEVFQIVTDKKTVGEALIEKGLLEGEEGPYGLYVKVVNGIPLDYNTDGMYWSFYVDGEYGLTGVDMTDIVPGTTYMFKAEAA